ncbi:MAG: DctP family TRAP transporter solute-binding subunit [Oscillospiraceae bacterium]|nr:DctP family TRAP transporter solute-binding subunit [Oscillospiraceae bacterium]
MKKILALALALCMVLAFAATASAAPKELKWGSVHTEDHLATQMMMKAIDEINANAEGIHVTGFPNSVLGGSQDLVEGVQEGIVDIITEGPAQFAAWIPKAAQVEAPYLWKDVDHMLKALNGEYKDKLNELFDTIDVKILGTFYYGTRQLTVNKEVHTLDDLKGMKIRVPQADLYVKMIESWNAAATPMALNELYLALQTGTVDGQENPLTTYEAQKFYETNAKYIILTNHIICPNMMFMNGDVWNSLSEHDQEVVSTAIANAIEWQGQQQLEAEAKLADELTAKGCTVITPDETIKEATVPYIQPAIEDWDLLQTYAD